MFATQRTPLLFGRLMARILTAILATSETTSSLALRESESRSTISSAATALLSKKKQSIASIAGSMTTLAAASAAFLGTKSKVQKTIESANREVKAIKDDVASFLEKDLGLSKEQSAAEACKSAYDEGLLYSENRKLFMAQSFISYILDIVEKHIPRGASTYIAGSVLSEIVGAETHARTKLDISKASGKEIQKVLSRVSIDSSTSNEQEFSVALVSEIVLQRKWMPYDSLTELFSRVHIPRQEYREAVHRIMREECKCSCDDADMAKVAKLFAVVCSSKGWIDHGFMRPGACGIDYVLSLILAYTQHHNLAVKRYSCIAFGHALRTSKSRPSDLAVFIRHFERMESSMSFKDLDKIAEDTGNNGFAEYALRLASIYATNCAADQVDERDIIFGSFSCSGFHSSSESSSSLTESKEYGFVDEMDGLAFQKLPFAPGFVLFPKLRVLCNFSPYLQTARFDESIAYFEFKIMSPEGTHIGWIPEHSFPDLETAEGISGLSGSQVLVGYGIKPKRQQSDRTSGEEAQIFSSFRISHDMEILHFKVGDVISSKLTILTLQSTGEEQQRISFFRNGERIATTIVVQPKYRLVPAVSVQPFGFGAAKFSAPLFVEACHLPHLDPQRSY